MRLSFYFSDESLRLVSSNAPTTTFLSAGRLEIYKEGEWGTICGSGFGLTEARLACRHLGFKDVTNFGNVSQLG